MRRRNQTTGIAEALTTAPAEMVGSIVPSPCGWCGVAGDEMGVALVTLGHAARNDAVAALRCRGAVAAGEPSSVVRDAAAEIERYLAGEPVDLTVFPVYVGRQTEFQQRVVRALRQVGYGEVVSYGELASRAAAPRAARAVGTVMARNPTPLLVPCHRVIASQGKLGGFSAPQGIALKQALLSLEQGAADALGPARSRPLHCKAPRAASGMTSSTLPLRTA